MLMPLEPPTAPNQTHSCFEVQAGVLSDTAQLPLHMCRPRHPESLGSGTLCCGLPLHRPIVSKESIHIGGSQFLQGRVDSVFLVVPRSRELITHW